MFVVLNKMCIAKIVHNLSLSAFLTTRFAIVYNVVIKIMTCQ